ncbi:MAG: outer membrane lipoprotein-sorting protein [Cyclobacteriaceae bacterium]|nr:outer membrane lipoprotein-sorting protein [Cyclobacteriaceae bacterium]
MKYFAIIVFSISTILANAQNGSDHGLEIANNADLADNGFESSEVKLKMILRNKQGQESTRLLETKTLELVEDGDKSLIVFNSPRDVKGTATLTFTHKQGSDDQWLYLPAVNRVKRISSDNKSGPFMGSEFAYEDLSSQEIEKYSYRFVKNEQYEGHNCAVVAQDPVDPKSGYTKRLVWYNLDEDYRLEKIEFYDRKDVLLKTLTYSDYQLYLGKHWRAGTFQMVNHQTDKQTTLIFEDYAFKTGLNAEDFSQNSLKRAGR